MDAGLDLDRMSEADSESNGSVATSTARSRSVEQFASSFWNRTNGGAGPSDPDFDLIPDTLRRIQSRRSKPQLFAPPPPLGGSPRVGEMQHQHAANLADTGSVEIPGSHEATRANGAVDLPSVELAAAAAAAKELEVAAALLLDATSRTAPTHEATLRLAIAQHGRTLQDFWCNPRVALRIANSSVEALRGLTQPSPKASGAAGGGREHTNATRVAVKANARLLTFAVDELVATEPQIDALHLPQGLHEALATVVMLTLTSRLQFMDDTALALAVAIESLTFVREGRSENVALDAVKVVLADAEHFSEEAVRAATCWVGSQVSDGDAHVVGVESVVGDLIHVLEVSSVHSGATPQAGDRDAGSLHHGKYTVADDVVSVVCDTLRRLVEREVTEDGAHQGGNLVALLVDAQCFDVVRDLIESRSCNCATVSRALKLISAVAAKVVLDASQSSDSLAGVSQSFASVLRAALDAFGDANDTIVCDVAQSILTIGGSHRTTAIWQALVETEVAAALLRLLELRFLSNTVVLRTVLAAIHVTARMLRRGVAELVASPDEGSANEDTVRALVVALSALKPFVGSQVCLDHLRLLTHSLRVSEAVAACILRHGALRCVLQMFMKQRSDDELLASSEFLVLAASASSNDARLVHQNSVRTAADRQLVEAGIRAAFSSLDELAQVRVAFGKLLRRMCRECDPAIEGDIAGITSILRVATPHCVAAIEMLSTAPAAAEGDAIIAAVEFVAATATALHRLADSGEASPDLCLFIEEQNLSEASLRCATAVHLQQSPKRTVVGFLLAGLFRYLPGARRSISRCSEAVAVIGIAGADHAGHVLRRNERDLCEAVGAEIAPSGSAAETSSAAESLPPMSALPSPIAANAVVVSGDASASFALLTARIIISDEERRARDFVEAWEEDAVKSINLAWAATAHSANDLTRTTRRAGALLIDSHNLLASVLQTAVQETVSHAHSEAVRIAIRAVPRPRVGSAPSPPRRNTGYDATAIVIDCESHERQVIESLECDALRNIFVAEKESAAVVILRSALSRLSPHRARTAWADEIDGDECISHTPASTAAAAAAAKAPTPPPAPQRHGSHHVRHTQHWRPVSAATSIGGAREPGGVSRDAAQAMMLRSEVTRLKEVCATNTEIIGRQSRQIATANDAITRLVEFIVSEGYDLRGIPSLAPRPSNASADAGDAVQPPSSAAPSSVSNRSNGSGDAHHHPHAHYQRWNTSQRPR